MNLFKKIAFCASFILSVYFTFSQEISIRGGLNISQMAEIINGANISDDLKVKPGFHFGPALRIKFNKTFSLESGVFYSTKGLNRKGSIGYEKKVYSYKFNLTYLETPLTLKVKIFSRDLSLYGFGGGYFAPALFGTVYENFDISKDEGVRTKFTWNRGNNYSIKRFDYGGNLGVEIQNDNFRIGISYLHGLANLSYNNVSTYNRTLEIYLAYQLWAK